MFMRGMVDESMHPHGMRKGRLPVLPGPNMLIMGVVVEGSTLHSLVPLLIMFPVGMYV